MHALYQFYKIHRIYKKGHRQVTTGYLSDSGDRKMFFLVPQEPLCQYLTNISTNHTLVKETAVLLRKLDPVIKSLQLFAMY